MLSKNYQAQVSLYLHQNYSEMKIKAAAVANISELLSQLLITLAFLSLLKGKHWDFPGAAVVKNPRANAGDTGSSPGLGRSHMPWSN